MDEPTSAISQGGPSGNPPDLIVRGKPFNLIQVVPGILLCAALVWLMHRGEAGGAIVVIILILAVISVYSGALQWLRPPKIELAHGRFSICVAGKQFSCPVADVANIVLMAKHVLVVFRDLAQVWPERRRETLADRHQKQGFHVGGAPGEFTLDEVNEVRSALGLVPQPADEAGDRIDRFHALLRRLTPRALVTPALVAACVGVFIAMVVSGVGFLNPTNEDLIAWGANYGPKTLDGQWWRLVTSMFVHIGILHILFNLWVLWDIGRLIERFVGNVGFFLAYMISGTAGSMASVWRHPHILSAGASGAIFGILGLFLVLVLRGRGTIPEEMYHALRGSVIAFLAFNLFFGFSVQGIDMAAHLGGLVAGCLVGAILARPLSEQAAAGRIWRNLLVAILGTIGLFAASRALPEAPGDFPAALAHFSAVEKQAVQASGAAEDKWRAGRLNDEQFADILVRDVLVPWREARGRLMAIRSPPPSDAPLLARLLKYAQLRQEAWEATVAWLRTKDPSKLNEANRKMEAAMAVLKEINEAGHGKS